MGAVLYFEVCLEYQIDGCMVIYYNVISVEGPCEDIAIEASSVRDVSIVKCTTTQAPPDADYYPGEENSLYITMFFLLITTCFAFPL